jgi:hypothetical protein
MMNKNTKIALLGVALILLLLFAWFNSDRSRFSWAENYRDQGAQPYDLDVAHDLLKDYNAVGLADLKKDLSKLNIGDTANYVCIGEAFYFDSLDMAHLLNFVDGGGTALLSSKTVPYDLMPRLFGESICDSLVWEDYDMLWDTFVVANFWHDLLFDTLGTRFHYALKNKPTAHGWHFMDGAYFCKDPTEMQIIGTINLHDTMEYANFVRIPYGKGIFYLHTTPIAFTNYHLIRPEAVAYAEKVFSHLNKGKIYWDSQARQSEAFGRRRNERARGMASAELGDKGPLQYILGQRELQWAWYALLFMGLLFIVFKAKRQQRIVPVLHPKTNTSLEFVSTLGALYFKQGSNPNLCRDKMAMLLAFIRERYNIPTKTLDEDFMERLAAKSGIDIKFINHLFFYYHNIENSKSLSDNTLMEFHREVEHFYSLCK